MPWEGKTSTPSGCMHNASNSPFQKQVGRVHYVVIRRVPHPNSDEYASPG